MNEQNLNTSHFPTWCPGCGDFGIWSALKRAIVVLGWEKDQVVVVYGIGCAGNMTNTLDVVGFHGLHGRPIPVAFGVKLANHNLHVIVIAGDGDTFGEGSNHLLHAGRANADMTVIVHNNQRYSLTLGQPSPTADQGTVTKVSPEGSIESPVNPVVFALTAGASFVGQGFAGDIPHLTDLFCRAFSHSGFSFVDVLQPCVTFNPVNSYQYFRERVKKVNPAKTLKDAISLALGKEKFPIGVLWEETRSAYHENLPQCQAGPFISHGSKKRNIMKLMESFL